MLRKTRAAVFYLATANFIFAWRSTGVRGDARASGARLSGIPEGAAAAAMEVATTLLDGYTPDILPDNGRSGSH